MNDSKFIALDVHKTSISAAVLDHDGKLVMQSVFATHAAAILSFIRGLRGTLRITFEEGTHSSWLYDLLRPYVTEVLVCNPRKNALLKSGNKGGAVRCAYCALRNLPIERGVLDHPRDQIGERRAGMRGKLGHQRRRGHAGLGVDFQAREAVGNSG